MIPRHKAMALGLSACFAFPQMALSATVVCAGTVEAVGVHLPGRVFLRLSSMNDSAIVCRLDADWAPAGAQSGPTTPSVCKSIYAALLLARDSRRPLDSVYMDGNTVPASCSAFGSWTEVSLRYFSY
jgi:hypothetical protein